MTGLNTKLIHGDDDTFNRVPDIIQPINVASTFEYNSDPDKLVKAKDQKISEASEVHPFYSRISHPNSLKAEAVLSTVLDGHVVVYNSGLSAFFGALTHFNPKVLAIGNGYHGSHGVANLFTRLNGLKQVSLEEYDKLGPGDIIHVETPENPYGTAHDLSFYVAEAHKRGAIVIADATFAPPPLQNPFEFGVDLVLHSGTKYFGGHSDLLAGVLVTKDIKVKHALIGDRSYLGTNISNLDSYLLLRSLRTFEIRVLKQSSNAEKIVQYLSANKDKYPVLKNIFHSSLQKEAFVSKQLKHHGPVFAIELTSSDSAKRLPSKLKYFHHATSLGGVESIIEWRAMSDPGISETILRISVGIEDVEDLIADLDHGLSSFN
ncbi:hypothetical protein OGAPHI_000502 [Ogataea philodendri]|uniref:Cystathionine beta-lyase n=1 Tax=Ogataea philodendri TaxID=1378263 RepID=A0A9P8PHD0_9ASCO|nr:uncharacterized protein OGAPHI_000502 [Ogataea philodendri]KAH3671279.1 hypothetical protein OGAPHI_000502 [Ogataea philodendri]